MGLILCFILQILSQRATLLEATGHLYEWGLTIWKYAVIIEPKGASTIETFTADKHYKPLVLKAVYHVWICSEFYD